MFRISILTRVLIVSVLLTVALPGASFGAGDPFVVQNSYEGLDHEGYGLPECCHRIFHENHS